MLLLSVRGELIMKKYCLFLHMLGVLMMIGHVQGATREALMDLVPTDIQAIPGYSARIVCSYTDKVDAAGRIYGAKDRQPRYMGEVVFKIWAEKQEVGQILLQWYPQCDIYPGHTLRNILRLRDITIGEDTFFGAPHRLQKRGFGTQALETLFVSLRQRSALSPSTHVWLECKTYKPYLPGWYGSFGFKKETTPRSLTDEGVQYMSVPLLQTKFPHHKKLKAATS
jgi:hypothetical protein